MISPAIIMSALELGFVYALVAMAIGAVLVPNHSGFVALVFYVVAGLGWVLPAGLIIKWMERGRL